MCRHLLRVCRKLYYAQSDRGTITGTVVDPDGSVVPGASVVAENPENGARYETVTTQTGNYTLAQVPVGTYNVHVELAGFGRFRQEGIRHLRRSDGPDRREAAARQPRRRGERCRRCVAARHPKRGNRLERDQRKSQLAAAQLRRARQFRRRPRFGIPYSFVTLVPGGNISSYSSLKVGGAPLNTFQIRVEGMEVEQPSPDDSGRPGAAVGRIARRNDGSHEQFRRRIRTGGGRHLQPDRQIGHQHAAREPLRVLRQRKARRRHPVHQRRSAASSSDRRTAATTLVAASAVRSTMPGVYDGRNRTFFFYSFEQFRQVETRSGLLATMPTDRMRNGDFGEALTGRQLGVDPLGRPIMENAIYDPRTTRVVNGQVVQRPLPRQRDPAENCSTRSR